MFVLLAVGLAHAGAWEAFGDPPPGHRLVGESVGADLVRTEWESPGLGRYWIDLTPDAGGSAFCRGGGLVLQVRRSLAADAESFVLASVPAPVAQACERLATGAPPLLVQMRALRVDEGGPGPDGEPLPPGSPAPTARLAIFAPRLLHPLVVAAGLGALVVALRTRRRAWLHALALFAGALGVRLVGSTPTVLLGGDAAYERLVSALGRGGIDRYYGDTWMSALGLLHEGRLALGLGGPPTDFVHGVNLTLSSLAPVFLAGLALRLGLPRLTALAAGVALAALPQAVALAQIEDHAPAVATLQLLTAWAALGPSRAHAALAACAAGLLAHLRPDQLPTAALLLLPLARPHRAAFGVGLALVLARLAYLPEVAHNPIDLGRLLHPAGFLTMLRTFVAPWGVAGAVAGALALLGAAAGVPRWRELPARWGWVALVFAATTLPYLPKSQPAADPLRFSLPGASWLLLLGAAGLTLLVPALRRDAAGTAKRALGLALALAAVAFVSPSSPAERFDRPWAWEREYAFLRAHLPAEPGAAHSGWYDASQDPNGAFALWMQLRTGLPWRAWGSGHPERGDLVVRGTADRLSGAWAGAACGLDPLHEENVAPLSDGWVDFGEDAVPIALYAVRDCPRP